MTEHHDLDRQLNAFLLDGPTSLPDSSFDAVRDRTEQTRQRVVLGPWRVPTLNKLIPIGLGAAALVVALLLGSRFIGSPSSNVGGPASEPPASAAPSEAPSSSGPGIGGAVARISSAADPELHLADARVLRVLPRGWTARAATEPWTGQDAFDSSPCIRVADCLSDPLTDQSVPATPPRSRSTSSTPDEWIASRWGRESASATEPIAVMAHAD